MRLKHLLSVFLTLLTLSVGQMWGAIYFEDTFSNVGNQDNQSVSSRSGWSNFSTCYSQGNSGLRVGSKNNGGSVKKTAMAGISGTKDLKVTVYVAKYSTNANTLTITCTNGTISGNSIVISPSGNAGVSGTTDAATWTDAYKTEFTITGASSSTTITFSSNKRVVLGPVKIEDAVASCDKKVTITKGTPETGGSFNLDKTGEQNCCNALTVTVSNITAPSGKQFSAITQSGINSGVTIDQNAKTVTYAANSSGSSIINVTFEDLPKYTVTLMDDNDTRTQASYGASVTLPSREGCEGYTFAGWSTTNNTSWTTTAPTIIPAGSYTPTNNENLYPVYTKTEGGSGFSSYTKVTSTPDDWSGQYILSTGSYTATGAMANNTYLTRDTYTAFTTEATSREFTLAKVGSTGYYIKFGNNYLGYDTSTKFKTTTTAPTTSSTAYLWTPSISGITNVGTNTRTIADNGSSDFRPYSSPSSGIVYLYKRIEGGSTTYYISVQNCCTPLGSINGSFTLSQLSPNPVEGKLKASWQLDGTTGIGSLKLQLWKKGSPDAQVGEDINITPINTTAQSYTFEDLDYCATYYAKLIAAKDGGTYCTNGWTETSNEATTIGYAITLPANGKVMDGQTEMGTVTSSATRACAGDQVTLTATPTSPYTGGAIVVKKTSDDTNVTSDYFNAGTGKLTMPAFGVTISATFTAPTQPSLSATGEVLNENELAFGNQEKNVQSAGKTFTISGLNLTANVTWALSGTDASMFSVSPASPIAQATAEAGQAITVKFTPTSTGDKTATLTFSSTGAVDKVINLTGTGIELYTISLNAGTGAVSTEGWTLNNGVYTKKQAALNEEITLPTATVGAQGWSFLGWAASSVSQATNNEPTLQATTFTPGSSTTFYAVYRKTITEGGTSQIKMSYGSVEGWTISEGVSGSSYYFLEKDEYIESPEIADMSAISSIKVTVGAYNNAGAYKIEAGGTQIISDTKPGSSSVDRTYNATTYFPALSGTGKIRLTNTDGVVQSNSQQSGTRMHAMTINIDVAAVYSYHSTPASATGLAVQVAPTKTVYKVGDTFDPAGTTLRVTYSNSTTEDITSGFTYSPTTALTKENTNVTFSYLGLNCNQAISVLDPVATPTFNPTSGSEISVTETVTISCETASATIYYTTDGSDPTNTSAVYSTPIAPYSTIKAIAMKAGMAPSEIATATYTVVKNSQTLSFTNSSYSFRLNSDEYNAFTHQAVSGAQTTVTYSSNKTSVADVEDGVVVLKGGKGTATITATAAETATYSEASATYTITVLRAGVTRTGDFVLVTDVNDLSEGDYVILTEEDDDNPYVFSGISTSNAGTVQVKNSANDVITYSQFTSEGNEAKIIYLEKVGDYWAFNYGTESDVYIAAGTSTADKSAALRGISPIDDYCKWAISFDGKNAIAENQGNSIYPILSFNSSAVKSYKTKQSGGLRIYKQQDRNLTPQTLSFETASYEFPLNESGYTSFTHQTVSGAQTAVTYTSDNTDVAAIVNNEVVLQGKVGTATITATAEADETYQTASATYTITVTAALRTVTFHYYKAADATADQTALKELTSGAGITVPAKPANVGEYTFLGWAPATLVETQTAPNNLVAALQAGATYHPATSEEYYAIYRRLENSDGRFYLMHEVNNTPNYAKAPVGDEFGNTTDIAEAAKFVQTEDNKLYYYNGSTPTYIKGTNNGTGAAGRALDFTTNEAEALVWTITENGQIVSYFDSNTEKYFAHNNTMWAGYASSSITQANQSKDLTKVYLSHVYYSSTPNLMVSPVLTWAHGNATHVMEIEDTYDNAATATVNDVPVSVTYSSSDETKATVNNAGVVTAHLGGLVTITATVAENPGVSRQLVETYQVSITKKVPQITFDNEANWKVYIGEAYKRVLAGQVTITTDGAVTYTLSNNATSSDWASINSETGEVTGLSTGGQSSKFQNFYVHTAETDMYQSGEAYKQFNVLALKNQTLTFGQNAYVFDMNETVAPFVNTLSGNQTAVAYGSDNTDVAEVDEASGEVTVHTNVCGVATITATAAEGYSGTDVYNQATQSYTITVNYPRPTISVASCEFKAPFEVALSSEATNVEMIVYTTDGTDPSYAGNYGDIYTEPIAINATTTLKAIAVSDEDEESPVATATYTKLVPELTEYSYEDNASLAANTEMTITASEGALVAYVICDANNVELTREVGTTNSITFQIAEAGTYKIYAQAKWDVENGFKSATELRTVHIKGAVHLPISYEGNGTGITSEPYFTVEGAALGDYPNYSNAPIQVKGNTILTIAFLDEPSNVVFYAGKNGSPWTSTLKLQESADGLTFDDVKTFSDGDLEFSNTGYGNNNGGTKQNLNLKSTTRFVRWSYTKVNGNVALGKIAIYPKSMEPDNSYEVPVDFTGDVVVEDGVAWNITETQTINDLTVKQGAEVWNNEAITVNNLYIEAQEGKSGQITENESITINGNAYYDLTLNTSGTMDNSLWYAFAVPFQVDAATGIQRLSNDGVASPAQFNGHYVLLKYNSEAYASAGEGWEYMTAGETLMPGKFYMIALNSNAYNRVRMTKKAGTTLNNKADLSLTLVGAGEHANWNALANNALAYANVSATGANAGLKVQVYNSATNTYSAFAYNKVTFTVGTPFFLQAAEAGTMSVNIAETNNETVKAPAREAVATEEFEIRLGENTESYYDILYVSASDEALNSYQIGHDLSKVGLSTTVPQMYVPAYGLKLCDAEFPLVNNEATFPLTFTAPSAGTYQLYIAEAAADAELYLQKDGATIWNLTMGAYPLELPQGTTENYGLLLKAKAPGGATGIENCGMLNGANGVQKVIIDDHVYILRGGQMYDVTGKAVK